MQLPVVRECNRTFSPVNVDIGDRHVLDCEHNYVQSRSRISAKVCFTPECFTLVCVCTTMSSSRRCFVANKIGDRVS